MANPNVVACLDENAYRQSGSTTQKKETAVSSEQSRKGSPSVSKTGAADVPLVSQHVFPYPEQVPVDIKTLKTMTLGVLEKVDDER